MGMEKASIIRFLVENYYDQQKLRIQTFNRLVAWVKETDPKLSEGEYARIARDLLSRKRETPAEMKDLVWYYETLHGNEKELAKKISNWSEDHPLRTNYLDKIQGIGPIFGSALIAWLEPISRFPNISKLWAYCGLAPGQTRQRGKKLNYNPRLKVLAWKIASSFEKQKAEKSIYRRLYDKQKSYYLARQDLAGDIAEKKKGAKLHVQLLTKRFVAKRFLADLWLVWRLQEGLPVTRPYVHDVLGETHFDQPKVDKEE